MQNAVMVPHAPLNLPRCRPRPGRQHPEYV